MNFIYITLYPLDTGCKLNYIRRPKDVLDVLCISYARSIYVLYLEGCFFFNLSVFILFTVSVAVFTVIL